MDKSLEALLLDKGIAPTAMRLLVLDCLTKAGVALSLSQVESSLQPADRVTIYRTLKTFMKKGMVHEVQEGHTAKYAVCGSSCIEDAHQDMHLHFYCTLCQQTSCLPSVSIPRINFPQGYKVEALDLLAKGRCEACLA